MASKPGLLTEWPWAPLGSFKYVILAPWVIHSTYSFVVKGGEERDLGNFVIFPSILWRLLHNQIWITLSRYRTAKGKNLIVDKSIEFEQVDRERNWDDQILLSGILLYVGSWGLKCASGLPLWRTEGALVTVLMHAGPVEFLYYWFHRALHHHFLYSRYHSHHHSSIVTEPNTAVTHPFAEHVAYYILFAMPMLAMLFTGTASIIVMASYITYVDFMNSMGHCNFELIPNRLFSVFPPLKYLMYTPSFHSLHHTQFRTNYSLFMPFYDYIYGTMDKSTDTLYESSLKRREDSPDVVHLMHLTTPQSVYQLRLGFASLASKPLASKWYLWTIWPVTLWSMMFTWIYGHTFLVEKNVFNKLKLQSWAIPRYTIHYALKWQRVAINKLIEEAILEAEAKGAKVLSLGLLNQAEELNKYGDIYIQRNPELNVKLVDGSSLAVAVVLNSIPDGTDEVIFRGKLSKVAYYVVFALCHKGIKVVTLREDEYEKLKMAMKPDHRTNLLLLSKNATVSAATTDHKVWLVGEGSSEDLCKASKGTIFIPYSQFPPKKTRSDCFFLTTPAMLTPPSLENLHACENWLPRRVMSAWRVAGVVHALEGWNVHECGDKIFDADKIWQASLKHGFRPYVPKP